MDECVLVAECVGGGLAEGTLGQHVALVGDKRRIGYSADALVFREMI